MLKRPKKNGKVIHISNQAVNGMATNQQQTTHNVVPMTASLLFTSSSRIQKIQKSTRTSEMLKWARCTWKCSKIWYFVWSTLLSSTPLSFRSDSISSLLHLCFEWLKTPEKKQAFPEEERAAVLLQARQQAVRRNFLPIILSYWSLISYSTENGHWLRQSQVCNVPRGLRLTRGARGDPKKIKFQLIASKAIEQIPTRYLISLHSPWLLPSDDRSIITLALAKVERCQILTEHFDQPTFWNQNIASALSSSLFVFVVIFFLYFPFVNSSRSRYYFLFETPYATCR